MHAMIGWWDCEFSRLKNPITLPTGPRTKGTHWKQTVFYLEHDLECNKGDEITGSICSRRALDNYRNLDIKISYHFDANK